MSGNVSQAINFVTSAEQASEGKEGAFSDPSMFAKYRVFRVAHTAGNEAAWPIASEAKARFRDRHPFYYLNALAAAAWLEPRGRGAHRAEKAPPPPGLYSLRPPRRKDVSHSPARLASARYIQTTSR